MVINPHLLVTCKYSYYPGRVWNGKIRHNGGMLWEAHSVNLWSTQWGLEEKRDTLVQATFFPYLYSQLSQLSPCCQSCLLNCSSHCCQMEVISLTSKVPWLQFSLMTVLAFILYVELCAYSVCHIRKIPGYCAAISFPLRLSGLILS